MNPNSTGADFRIWGADNVIYGPVELPMLINWVKDERVTANTWVFSEKDDRWQKAAQLPEMRMFFRAAPTAPASEAGEPSARVSALGVKPGSLRRVKLFSDFRDE